VLGLCLTMLYVTLDAQLSTALDDDLHVRSDEIAAGLRAGDTADVTRDPLAQLYALDGTILASSPSLAGHRLLSTDQVRGLRSEAYQNRSLPRGGADADTTVRLLSRQVEQSAVLTVGVSAEPLQAARQWLLAVLLIASPLLLAALAGVGWLVVRAALRPVDILTREAAEISALDVDRQLPAVPGDDEIARLARTLDDMLGRLRVAIARERAFVDDASHELRSPIAVLRAEIDLALSALDEPVEVERSLLAARSESERLTRLSEDLLLLARHRTGTQVVRREPVDLYDLVANEARRLGPVLGLRIDVTGDPAVLEGDAGRLRQLLGNLLHNSAAAGASTVHVHLDRDATSATLVVADDGPGFPPGVLDSAFERFVRGDSARTPRSSGAGLGLSIVRAVVAGHEGTVAAANGGPLGGAVVTARLPLT
jgi:signal transduction histidine kinase